MGIPTLIKTQAASNSASLDFVDGTSDVVLDGTYDEYMFVFTDINPATDNTDFVFLGSSNGGTGYGVTKTTTAFRAKHTEADSTSFGYLTGYDRAQSTDTQVLAYGVGSDSDESTAGIFHIFNPSSTTYVKHFYSRFSAYSASIETTDIFIAGYWNTTSAIDAVQFKMLSGNFDGVIQLYGIS